LAFSSVKVWEDQQPERSISLPDAALLDPGYYQDVLNDAKLFEHRPQFFASRANHGVRTMNGTTARFLRLGVALSGLAVLGWVLTGHAAKPAKDGMPLPTDWSHRHLIFSSPGSPEQLARVSEDPRYQQQLHRREQALTLPARLADEAVGAVAPESPNRGGKKLNDDWSEDLGSGGSVGAGNYPAKFSFDSTTANCGTAATPDFVVFSTGLSGAVNQANIVAYDNLYSGCTGPAPSVYWAYNTAGQVLTSPLISRDGSQVAFVQTNAGLEGTLVVLKWAPSTGTVSSPVPPTAVLPAAYSGCTAPCMTTIILKDHLGTPVDDTTSSVFYDYTNDVAWVGGGVGWLHKITGMFNGVPKEVNVGGFPVQVNSGNTLSSPVYDRISKNVFVGDAQGILYSVNSTTAAVTASAELDFGVGIEEGPVVDSTNGLVYVFASSDGSGSCAAGADCAAVYQLTTAFLAGDTGSEVTVGNSTISGTNPNPLYIGGFDSAYFSSVNATGNLYVCGNTGGNATLYQIPIQAGAMPASGLGLPITALAATSSTAPCSPVADVPNPNTTGGFSERLFASVQNDGVATACSSGGCIFNFVSAPWNANTAYAVGQQILSSKLHIETVITAGTSGATPPSWTNSAGAKRIDHLGGTLVWIDQGVLGAATIASWLPSHHYASTSARILDTNGNIEVATINTGNTGTVQPSPWNATPGGTTLDNTVVWTNAGPAPSLALASAGGTSGIIVDNEVNGTLAGTSQVYFTTLTDQVCGTSGTGGCAVQASQPGLD
jgi:hypothetical protein